MYVLVYFLGVRWRCLLLSAQKKVHSWGWCGSCCQQKVKLTKIQLIQQFYFFIPSPKPHYYLDSSNEGHAKCTDHQLQFRLTMHQTEHLRHTSNNTKRISLLNPQQFHRKTVQLLLKPKVSSPQVGGWSCSTIKSLP